MASITIRNLDESTKQALRQRAAANGRSMEEEARLLLAELERAQFPDPAGTGVPHQPPISAIPAAPAETPAPEPAIAGFPGAGKRVLLIISGGIAAYKCLDLIRRLRERGVHVRAVMTAAAQEFITPLSVGALTADTVFADLFDREDEHDVGHIRLARDCDLIIVAPATADLMAKMANGFAGDLASTVLLATNRPVLIAPAMNPAMWRHRATRRNAETLEKDGIHFIGPMAGEMAESGEAGEGRMAEPMQIVERAGELLDTRPKPLRGKRAIVTSGPTHEPIDPVRYIANRSSGKQGHAIAAALADLGAEVIVVSGPVSIPDPKGCEMVRVESAREMQRMVEAALPADIAVMVAAVADWRSRGEANEKMKKEGGKGPTHLELTENPDILKGLGHHKQRPALLIGFAAETQKVVEHARAKLERKNADWIIANDVSPDSGIGAGDGGVMGGDRNRVRILTRQGVEAWPELTKKEVAERLVARICEHLAAATTTA
ncbi:bifunctional phosphopantothenoylcysteine decarboxylase/phosphopantothenate--cysteine ligase CoaBC [Salaquimonas pukyongi]|uniref:bifunctional phosphopantothenoylcysteine decarboxylase/phosphopantothenate--cysteine ligase CoaBC n=1 Tax=Salaquimonas pukyongi TaxID=2712698 RepID=UPI00096B901F|nr:bifunctional phosphopantothenoylcysteine decarboxylase/phosphopantothenate--cysteine ligase CoaBC [Salaquimonas pukyongi]